MSKLTDTQRVILAHAAKRDDGAVLPLPASLTLNAGAAKTVLLSLLKKKLVSEEAAGLTDNHWREDGGGQKLTLRITTAGLLAIGIDEDQDVAKPAKTRARKTEKSKSTARAKPNGPTRKPPPSKPTADPAAARQIATGKVGQIQSLIERPDGASIDDLMAATGWQPHSVRAALTGLRKRAITIQRDRNDGVTRYRATT